jgi:hypothetical protein
MSEETNFLFRLKEHTENDVPDSSLAVKSALEFVNSIHSKWTKGKFYSHGGVQTYHSRINGDFWMARASKHTDVSFDSFKRGLLENHTDNEVKYIPLLESFKRLPSVDKLPGWECTLVHYKFPRFFSDREMTIWLHAVQPDPEVKQFIVISLPADRTVSEHVARAYYCSIELVTYNEQEECVDWLMAQTSDACGNIPRWLQDRSVTSSVVADVPHFIAWAKEHLEK